MTVAYTDNARTNMLKSQLLTGRILAPRILEALMAVARESFVPPSLKASAYVDEEIPLGSGRFLMEPLVFARLVAYADIQPDETVLDIAVGTGYSAAVLSHLAHKVVAVEEDAAFAAQATALLTGLPNVTVLQSPLVEGVSRSAPYDVILIEGAIEVLPQALADQLREGGRLLAVEHDAAARLASAGLGTLVEYRKLRGTLSKTVLHDASVALLKSFSKPPAFVF
jgi:protein-L-isoaspartate(D-aspartate) O-methyltransferase